MTSLTIMLSYRSHGLSRVVGDESLEEWYGSFKALFGDESEDTNLCKTAIIELLDESSFLLLRRLVFGKSKGVEKVEGHGVGNETRVVRKLGEGAGGSASHVMRASSLGEPLQESNKENDLPLGLHGHGIPLLWW